MLATGHRIAAPAFVLSLAAGSDFISRQAAGAGHPVWGVTSPIQVLLATTLAVPFAAGTRLSPDADLPSGWLGWLGHRRCAHWWGWPILAILLTELAAQALDGQRAPLAVHGPALGWLSHLVADWFFGKGGRSIPRGVPLLPHRDSPRTGLGIRVSAKRGRAEEALIGSKRRHSVAEGAATIALVPLACGAAWLYLSQAGIIT